VTSTRFPQDNTSEAALLVFASAAASASAILLGLIWSTTALTALFSTGHLISLSVRDVATTAAALPDHLTRPALAYPPSMQEAMGGGGLWWTLFLGQATAVIVATALGAVRLWPRVQTWTQPQQPRSAYPGARGGYATRRDIREGLSRTAAHRRTAHITTDPTRRRAAQHAQPGRGSTGTGPVPLLALGRDVHTGMQLFGSAEDSYLYLGPPRSGKGVHLVIPHTLSAPGAALVTATRPDTLRHTLAVRAQHGPVMVFDPQGLAGTDLPRLRWSPHQGCTDPLTAIGRARALATGARPATAGSTLTDSDFWQAMTEAVLRCYLHAAALNNLTIRDVLDWTGRPADPTPIRILRTHPDAAPGWAEELTAQAAADPRQRDSVWAGVRRAFDSLADPRVLDACTPTPADLFDPRTFLTSRGTLYLLGSTGSQLSVAPLITALVEALVDTARQLGATDPSGRLTPPVTLILDEAANIAPLPSLPSLLADGGGSGITTLCVLQSLAQARARWGDAGADTIWDASTLKVILGGLAHAEDLHQISRLAGEIDQPTLSRTSGPGGPSRSVSARRLPALPPETIRTLPVGHALVLARRTPPVHAKLTPWWKGPDARGILRALHAPGLLP
jgi:type IV secretory pathway TraG/TraD family ATPase VirD4